MNVLVLNCGSATLKFQLIQTDAEAIVNNTDRTLARGAIERIGGEAVLAFHGPESTLRTSAPVRDVRAAVDHVVRWLVSPDSRIGEIESVAGIHAAGHRVVHGGERFRQSALLQPEVLRGIEDMIDLAPLHNPGNIAGIRAVESILGPALPQVAVFDTAFHQTLPERAFLYAIPYPFYRRHRVRRYGFHGTSHRYVAHRYRQMTGKDRASTNIITLHLGNGCSACAIRGGESVDTSMGLTPLEGLAMGTRSGDLDPAVLSLLAAKEGLDVHGVETLLNKQSGLLGLSGLTHDMRELLAEVRENGDRRASLAVQVFCYRARKYIGAYLAAMGGADAVVFTGGIGENSAEIRARICDGLEWMGLRLDAARNEACAGGAEGPVHAAGSRLEAYVIPTDEELLIARDTFRCIQASRGERGAAR